MTMKPLQTTGISLPRAQQASALPLQATTIPASTTAAQLDITELMNLMITMMIVVMMMKMMSGMMAGV